MASTMWGRPHRVRSRGDAALRATHAAHENGPRRYDIWSNAKRAVVKGAKDTGRAIGKAAKDTGHAVVKGVSDVAGNPLGKIAMGVLAGPAGAAILGSLGGLLKNIPGGTTVAELGGDVADKVKQVWGDIPGHTTVEELVHGIGHAADSVGGDIGNMLRSSLGGGAGNIAALGLLGAGIAEAGGKYKHAQGLLDKGLGYETDAWDSKDDLRRAAIAGLQDQSAPDLSFLNPANGNPYAALHQGHQVPALGLPPGPSTSDGGAHLPIHNAPPPPANIDTTPLPDTPPLGPGAAVPPLRLGPGRRPIGLGPDTPPSGPGPDASPPLDAPPPMPLPPSGPVPGGGQPDTQDVQPLGLAGGDAPPPGPVPAGIALRSRAPLPLGLATRPAAGGY